MTPDIVIASGMHDGLASASRVRPETLYFDVNQGCLARGGVVVQAPALAARICLILAARPGYVIPKTEIIDLLYGDREDGGPCSVNSLFEKYWAAAHGALGALGYACTRSYRGLMVEPRPWSRAA